MMGIAWASSYRISQNLCLKYSKDFKLRQFNIYILGLFLFSYLGAKLGYLYFSASNFFDIYTTSLSFWMGGGFVFYGGMIGGLVWTFLAIKILKILKPDHVNYFIPAAAIGHGLGRVGCFLAGCCYGYEMDHGVHFPIQLIEAFCLFLLAFYLLRNIKRTSLVALYVFLYSLLRFILEFARADEVRGYLPLGLSTSQGIALLLAIFSLFQLLLARKNSYLSFNK